MASSPEPGGAGHAHEEKSDPARHISPGIAHELNNILTIILGYTDRLILKHGDNPALEGHLKLISEAARRATTVVRTSAPPRANASPRQPPHLPSPPAV